MKALVHLPDPTVLSFVSSVRLEVGDEVGIVGEVWTQAQIDDTNDRAAEWVQLLKKKESPRRPLVTDLPFGWAVVATSTITEAKRLAAFTETKDSWWRYSLAPLRECPPITDLPCPNMVDSMLVYGVPGGLVHDAPCDRCTLSESCDHGRVPLPEVPTGKAVLL